MAVLSSNHQIIFDGIIDSAKKLYAEKDFSGVVRELEKAWEVFPEPKYKWNESYHVARDIASISLRANMFNKAEEWADVASLCDPERADFGEKEFLIGKVAFQVGKHDKARKFLSIAFEKSKGRLFLSEDEVYLKHIGKL